MARRPAAKSDVPARQVLSQLSTPVIVLDGSDRPTYRNAAAEAVIGARPEGGDRALPDTLLALARRARAEHREVTAHGLTLDRGRADAADVSISPLTQPEGWLLMEFLGTGGSRQGGESLLSRHDTASALIRMLGHELRNPLAGLKGAAQLLARELEQAPQLEYVQIIGRECDRLDELLSRLREPGESLAREPVNIHEVCERVLALVAAEAGPELHVDRDYDPSLPELTADRDALVQALLNLARNAWQAGARSLTLRTRLEHDGLIGATRYRQVMRLDCIDDGPGIPPAIRPLLFLPLVTASAGGSGMGLALAQGIAIRHDGLIGFESVPGNTVFTMRIPYPDPAND